MTVDGQFCFTDTDNPFCYCFDFQFDPSNLQQNFLHYTHFKMKIRLTKELKHKSKQKPHLSIDSRDKGHFFPVSVRHDFSTVSLPRYCSSYATKTPFYLFCFDKRLRKHLSCGVFIILPSGQKTPAFDVTSLMLYLYYRYL